MDTVAPVSPILRTRPAASNTRTLCFVIDSKLTLDLETIKR